MYTDFASVYDHFMRDVDYPEWAARYACMLKKSAVRITECACGTGSITFEMKKLGYDITGADLSEEMLALAMARARQAGLNIPFILQDMRALTVPAPRDAVLATCDGVNYLLSEKDVKRFFCGAYAALKSGGQLLFDVSSAYKLENTLGSSTLTLDEEDGAYLWRNTFDKRKRTVYMELTLFLRDEGSPERFRRVRETQTQRAHTREELEQWLYDCGFQSIRVTGKKAGKAPAKNDDRLFFAAEKP